MDLGKFEGLAKAFDEGIEIVIKDAFGNPTDLKVQVLSYQSDIVKKIARKKADVANRERVKNPKRVKTVAEMEEDGNDLMVAAVLSWSGFEVNGKALECTPENVRSVITNKDLFFIRKQIDEAADDQAGFLTASKQT